MSQEQPHDPRAIFHINIGSREFIAFAIEDVEITTIPVDSIREIYVDMVKKEVVVFHGESSFTFSESWVPVAISYLRSLM